MDEKYIQDLYDHLGGQTKFGKFDDFKELISSDPTYRKQFHDSFGDKQLGSYDDFESLVKKKGQDGSNVSATPLEATSSNTPNLETEIPLVSLEDNETANPIDLAAKYFELSNKTKKEAMPSSGKGGQNVMTVPDEGVKVDNNGQEYVMGGRKEAQDLKEFLKINRGVDADELYEETKDLTPNDYGRKGFSKEELLADRAENNQHYQRKIARLKWQSGLENALADRLVSGDIKKEDYDAINGAIQSSLKNADIGDYEQRRKNIATISNSIRLYGGADRDNILKNYAVEVGKIYGNSYKTGGVKIDEGSPESKYLTDPNEELGYQYIKDVSPDKAAQYERLFIDPKSLKNDPDALKGYNHLKLTLKETGIALQQNAVNEDLNNLSRIAERNGGLNEEQIKQAEELQKKNDELSKARTELDSQYPEKTDDKVDDATNEILGSNLGWGSYAAGKAGVAFKNTGQGVWEAVSTPFMSDESNKVRELAIMGEQGFDESVYRKSDADKSYQTDRLVIQPELQKQIDVIANDKSLTREQKAIKLYPLLKNNTDKFGRVPISGGKFNINPSSILYGVTDIGTAILPFVAAEVATGGVGGAGAGAAFLRTFTAAAATTFHDEYASAIAAGKPQSEAYKMAMINTAIGSAAMAGAGTAGKVREMIGGNTSAAQLIKGMSDEAIEAVIAKGTPKGMKAIGSAIKDRIKATPSMLAKGAKTGAEFEGAMTAANELKAQINNTPIDREQAFKQSLLQIANFTGLGLLSHVGYKPPTEMQKSTILDFGSKPEEFRATLEKMKSQLSPIEYQHRADLIDRSEEAVKTLPKSNAKGKELTSKEKGDYLYNTVIRNEANKAKSTLPPKQAAEAEHKALVADSKNDIILSNPTDKQLESQQSSLEKKLEPKKDAEGKAIELPEKEKASLEAELEAVKQTIEARQKEVPETEPSSSTTVSSGVKREDAENKVMTAGLSGNRTIADLIKETGKEYDFIDLGDGLVAFKMKDQSGSVQTYNVADLNNLTKDGFAPSYSIHKNYKGEFGEANKANVRDIAKANGQDESVISSRLSDARKRLIESENKPIQNEPIKEGTTSNEPIQTETGSTPKAEPNTGSSDAEPPKEETVTGAAESGDIGGITQAANEVRRQDRSMPEYQKTPESFEQWNNEAEKLIKDGYDVDKLIDKIEKGHDPSPVENAIRKIYVATLDAEIAKNPTNELLAKQKKFIEVGDAANARAGRNLVSLKGQGNPLSTISDFYVAKMEAVGSDTLTESQKAEVKGDYDKIKKERDAFEAKAKEAQDAFRLMQAENELLKQKKGSSAKSPKTTSAGKRDFAAERQSLKEKLKQQVADYKAAGQKVGISSDGGGESFVISAKIAKTITEIAKSHVDEIGVKIKDVAKKTLEDVREFFGDKVTEEDIMDVLAGKYNEKKETQNELAAKMRELKTEANLLQEYKRLLEGGEPKDEKKAIKRNQRLTELRNEIKGLENLDKEVEGIRDAELKAKADKNKETIAQLDKLEKEDKAAAAKKRRELEAENAKELQRLKEEFDKKLRENERKNKEDAIALQRKLKEQANDKQRQMDKEAAEFDKKLREEEIKKKKDEIDLLKELDRKLKYKTHAERTAAKAIEANLKAEQKIRDRIANKDFEPKPKAKSFMESPEFKQRHPKLFNEVLDSSNKKDAAQLEFERRLVEEDMKHWGAGKKFRAAVTKFSGTIKHIFASFDASAIAVQNLPLIMNNPVMGAEGIAYSFRDFASQKSFDRYLAELHNSPDWHIIKDSGLRVTEPQSLLESGREEYFPDRFKAVVKIKGKEYGWIKTKNGKYELLDISKPFERQFTSLGNWLRVVKFRTEAEKLYEKGYSYEKNPDEFKTLAKRINNLSSSADIPAAYQTKITKALIWSTRLIAAKLNMLGISDIAAAIPNTGVEKGYYKSLGIKGQKLSRQQVAAVKDLAGYAVGVMTATYLYALATGGKVNGNPDSNGFLDVEYGDGKSANFSGGYSRVISLITQMARGGKKDKLGVFRPYTNTDRVKEAVSFVGGKAPPLTRSFLNVAAGKDPGGQEADISTEASKYKMPLAVGQIYKQVEKDGYAALFNEGILNFVGFNTKDDRDFKHHEFDQSTKDFIEKNQIKIDFPKNEYVKDGEKAKMDDETYKKYVAAVDKRVEHALKELKENGVVGGNDMQEAVKEAVSEAVADTKLEMFGEQYQTPKMPSFINGHVPLPIKMGNQ